MTGRPSRPVCAVRRVITSPAQPGDTRRRCFGLPAHPRSKDRRDSSMLGQGTAVKGHCMAGRVSPADMVKAVVLEPQSPVVKVTTRRKKCLGSLRTAITAATPVHRHEPEADTPSQGWTLASEVKQGDEWGTYIGLGRVMTTYHGIAYSPRGPGRRSRHSSRWSDDQPGRAGKLRTGRRAVGVWVQRTGGLPMAELPTPSDAQPMRVQTLESGVR